MSLGNWGESLLQDAAGAFFGSEYLRDYKHASKTFRSNSYENAPKLKFLFHTYFDINPAAYAAQTNFGLLVKEVKLPTFTFATTQLNQYNRKRIVQTKIKYDPIEIVFHDDNKSKVTKLWESYYNYYYNDGINTAGAFTGVRGAGSSGIADYNTRNIYDNDTFDDEDWGFSGGQNSAQEGRKVPFFKNLTVFGFNQHEFTAYTLINPVIVNFQHDTYNYSEGGGTMQHRMSIDYEAVAYNYGAMDGRDPGSIVTGFGDPATYDTEVSPIARPGANGTILGQGGLIDAVGGAINALQGGNALDAAIIAGTAYNTFKNLNLTNTVTAELNALMRNAIQNTPNTRNTGFMFPIVGQTPGPLGLANSATIGAIQSPPAVEERPTAGETNTGNNLTNGNSGGGFPIEAPFGWSLA